MTTLTLDDLIFDDSLNDLSLNDVTVLTAETVILSEASLHWATEICQGMADQTQAWQAYLRALAVAGFDQWLRQGVTPMDSHYPLEQVPGKGVNLWVGDYRLCIVPMSSVSDNHIVLSASTMTDDNNFAHLYCLVEVQEEVEQIQIVATLRRDRIFAYLQSEHQSSQSRESTDYSVPIHLFDITPAHTILYLACLDASNFAAEDLGRPAVDSSNSPELEGVRASIDGLRQTVLNAGRWLQDQLDEVAEQAAWVLMPPLATDAALRSQIEELETIKDNLSQRNVEIPPRARAAFKHLQLAGFPLRLYALIWPVVDAETPEWSLFLCLGPDQGEVLPTGIYLKIYDQAKVCLQLVSLSQPLAQSGFQTNEDTFLYAQVLGTWDECFEVEIGLANDASLVLPAFGFKISN
jgi:Protein of unknown function (DUF1822)